jgi:FkbM family methyltransferase
MVLARHTRTVWPWSTRRGEAVGSVTASVAGRHSASPNTRRYAHPVWRRPIDAVAFASRTLPPLRGRGRVALFLQQRMSGPEGSWTINMRRGHRMTVPVSSAQSWSAAFTGAYDDDQIDLLVPFIEPGSFVLDIGASLGFYSVPLGLAAQKIGARVLAVEPVRANCEIIQRNLQLNGLMDVVDILPYALGRQDAEVSLHIESGGSGNATIVTGVDLGAVRQHDAAGNMAARETSRIRPLDGLPLPPEYRGRRCTLMKLDTEGFEMEVLLGATSFIATHRPVILAEFNPSWLQSRGVHAAAPLDWAAANGYSCKETTFSRESPISDVRRVSLTALDDPALRSGSDLLLLPD